MRKLGDMTVALGRHLAPHIREQGTRLLTHTFKSDQQGAQDAIDGVLTVAAGGAVGKTSLYARTSELKFVYSSVYKFI